MPNESFQALKKASYRVVLRGRIERPISVGLCNRDGEAISGVVTLQMPNGDFIPPRWLILKSHANALNARLCVEGEYRGRFELRRLDQGASRRRWIASILFTSLLGAVCFVHRARLSAQALALAVAYFFVLLPWSAPGFYSFGSDNRFYVPTSVSLLRSGHWNVDEFADETSPTDFQHDRRLRKGTDGHWYNFYPPGTALVCLPIVLIGDWLNDQFSNPLERAAIVSDLAAKIISAATVGLFFLVVSELTKRRGLAWIVTLIFAFATPQFGTHAGALWSHNASVFCATIALGIWVWQRGRFAAWSAIPLALGFACRPTMILPGLVFAGALLLRERKAFAVFCLLSGLCGVAFISYSWSVWERLLPTYYGGGNVAGGGNGFTAYLGTLVSPNRGLFVFSPVLLFALVGAWRTWRERGPRDIYLMATLVVVAEWIVASRNEFWWGGHCYGPRLLCELVPFATLLLLPAWEFLERTRARKIYFFLGILACAWGIFAQVQALANPRVHEWNALPDVDLHRERLWDWNDWQIFATR